MKYKVGDKVKIKSTEWYNKYRNHLGNVECGVLSFTHDMSGLCGTVMAIVSAQDNCYKMAGCGFTFTDEMIKGKIA